MQLEDLQANAAVRGILAEALVTVVSVQWFGAEALELTYKTPGGALASELLYRHDEARLEIARLGRPWSFDGDGVLFRLVSEARRIRLAHLFDPLLAVHTSLVEPLPHQITAVYESMLPRQPLRFLLADDPGAGKTIPVMRVAVNSPTTRRWCTTRRCCWPCYSSVMVLVYFPAASWSKPRMTRLPSASLPATSIQTMARSPTSVNVFLRKSKDCFYRFWWLPRPWRFLS